MLGVSKSAPEIGLFENPASLGGSCLRQLPRGPIVFTYALLVAGNGAGGFKNLPDTRQKKSWKFFIPRREAAVATPKGSNCFYLCFIGVDNGADGFDELMDGMDGLCIHTLSVYR